MTNEVVGMRALNSLKNFLQHRSNLASLTLIILISEMLQFSIFFFFPRIEFVEENTEISKIFYFSQSENCKINCNSTRHV